MFHVKQVLLLPDAEVPEDHIEQILDIDRRLQIPNASLTTYVREGAFLEPADFARTDHRDRVDDADVTHQADQAGAGSREQD